MLLQDVKKSNTVIIVVVIDLKGGDLSNGSFPDSRSVTQRDFITLSPTFVLVLEMIYYCIPWSSRGCSSTHFNRSSIHSSRYSPFDPFVSPPPLRKKKTSSESIK